MSQARDFADSFSAVSTGRRNLIINGAMNVAQRGTSNTTSAVYLLDRFKTDFGGGVLTNEQVSLTSSDTPYASGFRKALKFSNTTAGSTAASDYRRIQYFVEAQDVANSGWEYTSSSSYITLSFWVKSSVAGTYACNLQSNDGTAQNYSFEYTVAADTWTKVTHSAPGDSDITVNNDTGQGLRIYWWPYLGTNNTTSGHTNEAWAAYSSSSQVKDFAQNWASTANATFFVTGVQLEVGNSASPFEHRSYGEELALCQRYFYRIYAKGSVQSYNCFPFSGFCRSSTLAQIPIHWNQPMRSVPTMSYAGASSFGVLDSTGSTVVVSAISTSRTTENASVADWTSSGLSAGNGTRLLANNTADPFIDADAEL